jgi:nicotinamidase-related amidase
VTDTDRTALLVMDLQSGIVDSLPGVEPLLDRSVAALDAARAAGLTVVFVRVAFRPGAPEASPRNASFAALAGSDRLDETRAATQIHPAVAPLSGEVVTKRRVGAFSGSDLDVVLRAADIDHLVLAGIATSGVVLSTLRLAADLDYRLTVLSDACADRDDEVHRVLTQKVFPRQATVVTVAEWIASLDT